VIHAIRKLAREIHRRSVWQVVVTYLAVSWGLLSGVEVITDFAGLPSWTPTMTLVLLVMLLALVVATAVVQKGIPGLRIEDYVDPNELEGLTPDQVHVIPEAHALYGVGVFTWRNAVLGAVTAAVLLVTSVVAYLAMWALGIGPVGSLMAQGVITERDLVIVAAFENHTDDSSLALAVTDAFELHLAESRAVTLVDAELVAEALTRMGEDPAAPLLPELARRIAVQEGIRVVVEGDIARLRSGYDVSVRIVIADQRSPIARFRGTPSGDDDLILTIEHLSEKVREKFGESLRTIRSGNPLGRITTDSVEAMRLYGEAGRAATGGDDRRAIDLLEQAIDVDSEFAMAWRRLGVLYEQVADTVLAVGAYRRLVSLWADGGERGQRMVQDTRARIAALGG